LKGTIMATVGAFEAKTHFSQRLERVAGGEQVTITRHGMPVARLIPVAAPDRERIRQTIRRLKGFSEGQTLGGLSVRALRDEGRR
jgi:prevent-host-death family protein